MPTFSDKAGREWVLDLDVTALEQVESRTEVRLDQLLADGAAGLQTLFAQPRKLVRVLWVLIEERAAKVGLTPEQFGRSFDGDALERAADALLRAVADFTPSRRRPVLLAAIAKAQELEAKAVEIALAKIARTNLADLAPDSSTPATGSAASSASTPAADA